MAAKHLLLATALGSVVFGAPVVEERQTCAAL